MPSEVIPAPQAPAVSAESRAQPRVPGMATGEWLVVLALTGGSAALRLWHLGARSLWFDEGFSAGIALMKWPDFLRVSSGYSANMALYYLLLKFWMPLGNSDAWTRGLSAVFGIAAIPALYWLGRKLFHPGVGAASALLLAANAFHLRYSQEARAYPMVTFLVIVSAILLLRAMERMTTRPWLAWSLVSALAVMAHTYAILVIGAEVLWAFLAMNRTARGRLLAAVRWFVLALAPYAVVMTRGGSGAIAWLRPFTRQQLGDTIVQVSGGAGWWLPLLFLLACAGVFRMPREERRAFALVALWALLPFAAVIAMVYVKPLLFPRYMIVCLPGILLMATAGAARLPRALIVVWLLAALGLSLSTSAGYLRREAITPIDDWRSASAYVRAHRSPDDLLVFYTWQGTLAYHYYWWQADRSAPRADPRSLQYVNIAELLQDQPADAQHVWVFLDHFGGSDPNEIWIYGWFRQKYVIASERNFHNMTVVEYRRK